MENYYIGPDPGKKKVEAATRAYSLLVKILHETNKIAIGKVVLKEKEHIVALRAYQRGLVMHQLRYLDEIRPMDEIGNLDSLQKVDSKELSLGKTLVENLTTEKFDPGQYSDTAPTTSTSEPAPTEEPTTDTGTEEGGTTTQEHNSDLLH